MGVPAGSSLEGEEKTLANAGRSLPGRPCQRQDVDAVGGNPQLGDGGQFGRPPHRRHRGLAAGFLYAYNKSEKFREAATTVSRQMFIKTAARASSASVRRSGQSSASRRQVDGMSKLWSSEVKPCRGLG